MTQYNFCMQMSCLPQYIMFSDICKRSILISRMLGEGWISYKCVLLKVVKKSVSETVLKHKERIIVC